MSDNNVQIEVRDLYFNYGGNLVLEDISFEVLKGDFLALIGPNGSGKSTLVKIILGLLSPDRGSVKLLGQDVKAFQEWNRIGYIPQKATDLDPLFPASVREVVAMGLLSSMKFPRFMKRGTLDAIDGALALVGMEEFRSRRIGALSGGQQQRVFIARALASEPSILILDEPTTGVDAATQTQFYDMLDHINREKMITLVLVTHDIGVVTKHVNKVACLNRSLVFHGDHEEFCNSVQAARLFGPEVHIICHKH
ncbi:MAG: metal ABC transporter ATP-binding protein [bacterium]